MDQRARTFQTLKPACVALSEVALRYRSAKSPAEDVVRALQSLDGTINVLPEGALDLDNKLAEYVFYPISHIFRDKDSLPLRALEIASRILKSLLATSWRRDIAPELGIQLLILLTFLAGGSLDGRPNGRPSDELQIISFECQSLVFKSFAFSQASKVSVLDAKNMPAIGHAVTVMLDSLKTVDSAQVQLAAVDALHAFHRGLATREVSASFLPGLVSTLSHALTPTTKMKRSYRVLTRCLNLLDDALVLVLADDAIGSDPNSSETLNQSADTLIPKLDASWLQATGGQVKLALANVIKIRNHGRSEVKHALKDLCFDILENCRNSLSGCVQMLLQTIITLTHSLDHIESSERLKSLICLDDNFSDAIRSSLYDWLVSLPRLMQSNDDGAKHRISAQIASSLRLLADSDLDMSVINNVMLNNLRDSVSNILQHHVPVKGLISSSSSISDLNTSLQLVQRNGITTATTFTPIFTTRKNDQDDITSLETIVQEVSKLSNSLALVAQCLDSVRASSYGHHNDRISSLYLSLTILKSHADFNAVVSDFIDVSSSSDIFEGLLEDLYSVSLSVLTDGAETPSDWRIQALSLEAIAFYASRHGTDFRPDLVDTLYPVVHLLGASHSPIREHAITTLNILASSCGYRDAKNLLISNADYLVNSISLKISSFDIEPQAPQVLAMMVRLSGASIIPYLDDVVDGVFEALDAFHGYTRLTEVLFFALGAVVEVGVSAPALTIEGGGTNSREKDAIKPSSVREVVELLNNRHSKQKESEDAPIELPDRTPHKAWNKFKSSQNKGLIEELGDDSQAEEDSEVGNNEEPPSKEPPTPTTATYNIVQRITKLTQHHLPSASSFLRTSLLSLLRTSLPYLAQHEDSFLPLVHTLWPVLIPRLLDLEAFVVAATLNVLAAICRGAGDFVSSRVDNLWPMIRKIHNDNEDDARGHSGVKAGTKRTKASATSDPTSSTGPPRLLDRSELSISSSTAAVTTLAKAPASQSSLQARTDTKTPYVPTSTALLRSALTDFLLALISHVRVSDAVFGEICTEMLRQALVGDSEQAEHVRDVVQKRNPDVVWLVKQIERARTCKDRGDRVEKWAMPKDVMGAPRFKEVVF